MARAAGVSRSTVTIAVTELDSPEQVPQGRSRRAGGGRKAAVDNDPGLADVLDALADPLTRGDPESPLRWTCKSTRQLAAALTAAGHPVSDRTVARLLHQAGYSLQANAKTTEGRQRPDRDGQFTHINDAVRRYRKTGDPVISVDTKKKELIGETPGPPATRTTAENGNPPGNPSPSGCTTSPTPRCPRPCPTGSTVGRRGEGERRTLAASRRLTMVDRRVGCRWPRRCDDLQIRPDPVVLR